MSPIKDENDDSMCIEFEQLFNFETCEKPPPITSQQLFQQKPKLSATEVQFLYQLTSDLISVAKHFNITIFADGGTLLGAVRHKGLIPWDDDLDFSILSSNRRIFETRALELLRKWGYDFSPWWYGGWRIFKADSQKSIQDQDSCCSFPFADVFIMKAYAENNLAYLDGRAKALWPSGLNVQSCLPLQWLDFGPVKVPAPKKFDGHLNSLYGTDWREIAFDARDHRTGQFIPKKRFLIKDFKPLLPDKLEIISREFD